MHVIMYDVHSACNKGIILCTLFLITAAPDLAGGTGPWPGG